MKKLTVVLLVLLIAIAANAAAIQDFQGTATSRTKAQVEKAIITGAADRGWVTVKGADGHIQATLYVRQHMIKVDIIYDANGYTIKYVDSANMKYNANRNTIHDKYVTWVQNLHTDIQKRLYQQ